MISEEHIQLESSSVPVSSDGFHEAQHVQTALEPPVLEPAVSQPMTNSHTAEVPAQTLERDLSATVEEVELTTVLDRTLIEERNSADASTKKHAEVPMPKTRCSFFSCSQTISISNKLCVVVGGIDP